MYPPSTLFLLASSLISQAFSLPSPPPAPPGVPQTDYDAIVIGGGPSGLSALSGLARVRRHVLLIDSGVYRNAATRHAHDILGADGVTPAYYRWAGRQKIQQYDTVTMQNGTVTNIKPASDGQSFTITVTNSSSSSPYSVTARKLVLGTGLRDILPDTPGVKENWGKGFYWCPWCDGHEHEDQPLGFLGPLDEVAKSVREIWNLNTDIIAFVNGTDTEEMRAAATEDTAEWQEYLKLKNVTVVNATISDIVRLKNGDTGNENPNAASVEEHDLFRVDFVNDTTTQQASIERAVFFTSFKNTQASTLWSDVGLEMYKDRMVVDSSDMLSSVEGVYAVGDANSDNSTNVPHALYSGKKAAVYLHLQMELENANAELAAAGKPPKNRKRSDMIADVRKVAREMGNLLDHTELDSDDSVVDEFPNHEFGIRDAGDDAPKADDVMNEDFLPIY